jgi:hypothetical protein
MATQLLQVQHQVVNACKGAVTAELQKHVVNVPHPLQMLLTVKKPFYIRRSDANQTPAACQQHT